MRKWGKVRETLENGRGFPKRKSPWAPSCRGFIGLWQKLDKGLGNPYSDWLILWAILSEAEGRLTHSMPVPVAQLCLWLCTTYILPTHYGGLKALLTTSDWVVRYWSWWLVVDAINCLWPGGCLDRCQLDHSLLFKKSSHVNGSLVWYKIFTCIWYKLATLPRQSVNSVRATNLQLQCAWLCSCLRHCLGSLSQNGSGFVRNHFYLQFSLLSLAALEARLYKRAINSIRHAFPREVLRSWPPGKPATRPTTVSWLLRARVSALSGLVGCLGSP